MWHCTLNCEQKCLTVQLEPVLQGLGDIEGQPLVPPLVGDEAGSVVAHGAPVAVVELHPLLQQDHGILDEHPQLGAGEQLGIPDAVPYLRDVKVHRDDCRLVAADGDVFLCVIAKGKQRCSYASEGRVPEEGGLIWWQMVFKQVTYYFFSTLEFLILLNVIKTNV